MDLTDLSGLCALVQRNVTSKDRTYHFQNFKQCFIGSEAVDFMVNSKVVGTREEAVELGQQMLEQGLFQHVTQDRDFEDNKLFYRFKSLDRDRGHAEEGSTWAAVELQGGRPVGEDVGHGDEDEDVPVEPLDEHNVRLLDLCKPAKWVNPKPEKRYNMVVIGAGAGGLVTTASVAGTGGKVAIIEKHVMGGDCINVGCVPSKALLRCARAAKEVRNASEFGIEVADFTVNFGKIMERMRRLRASIAPNDSADRFTSLGADVFQGKARFVGPDEVEVDGQRLKFARAVIATGGRARVPPIPGIESVRYLTNASLFNLTELPEVFGVIGGGPIGSEMAQAFARFGSKVFLFDRSPKILPREDAEAAEIVQASMLADGVNFKFNAEVRHVEPAGEDGNRIALTVSCDGGPEEVIELDDLLISAGRVPNVEGLGLEEAGVEYNQRGIEVNDRLQTSNKSIFAVGDVCLPYQFTHASDFSARMVVRNALFFGNNKFSDLLIPWVTYTEPEVAHVGKYEHQLDEEGVAYDVYRVDMAENDRAILEGDTEGFVKVVCAKGKDTVLGATIVSDTAGDMIGEISVAMQNGIGLSGVGATIHSYPTRADAIRRTGDLYNKTRLTPRNKALLRTLLSLRR
ncbi:Dihydrolipoyl dehydrogenase, mitochondrial [Hondaea fermentalgiana]|uniref:Dihydrolipoyl dehydrogenase, mitochondrial n=1 Tax=Hondaea fermentalgiana TaxID=2315210 RepID=A0A2R5GBM1_9STRA|nr:Dihydrolipoyl dehydrogenase, mitochondrial [Hondaea fermentalgiana]|eukprot:GBG25134.1 Dihydrolipoyl dehydrogenase, mitochondrial [Hondaea fermentalgiana]